MPQDCALGVRLSPDKVSNSFNRMVNVAQPYRSRLSCAPAYYTYNTVPKALACAAPAVDVGPVLASTERA
jgi:hypothetical protein